MAAAKNCDYCGGNEEDHEDTIGFSYRTCGNCGESYSCLTGIALGWHLKCLGGAPAPKSPEPPCDECDEIKHEIEVLIAST